MTTYVKTKVQDLPCVGCDCTKQCKVLQGFTSKSKFCTDSTCLTERNASEPYVFGDQGWIEITMTPATRKFEVWELYASTDGSEASPLSLSYIRVNNSQNGRVIIGIPMAGPASLVGLDFGLNFVLRALPATSRFRYFLF